MNARFVQPFAHYIVGVPLNVPDQNIRPFQVTYTVM